MGHLMVFCFHVSLVVLVGRALSIMLGTQERAFEGEQVQEQEQEQEQVNGRFVLPNDVFFFFLSSSCIEFAVVEKIWGSFVTPWN